MRKVCLIRDLKELEKDDIGPGYTKMTTWIVMYKPSLNNKFLELLLIKTPSVV